MTTIYLALDDGLLILRGDGGGWNAEHRLEGVAPRCLAADPAHPERVWCGTDTAGLWRSDDGGVEWRATGDGLSGRSMSAVAVAPNEEAVYAGSDPSAMWRTANAGRDWEALTQLNALPSAPTWSFPPRPETSHVRWITLEPGHPDRLYVCIEAGALVRSADGGRTWTDRVPGGPWDTHTLGVHPQAPGRLYSAAGDGMGMPGHGYNESRDGGNTWAQPDAGIEHHYLYGLAVDSGDPDTVVVSAADTAQHAHSPQAAESWVYRRTGTGHWIEVRDGLPEAKGTLRTLFASDPDRRGNFYAANNRGVFRSEDGGASWEAVSARQGDAIRNRNVHAITVTA
jgi:photosystem II stability/assembly factor-like uncharacterized protein